MWESGAPGQRRANMSKSGMRPARPFPGSEAKVLARVCLSGLHRPALELSSQGIDSFFLEKWRKEAII